MKASAQLHTVTALPSGRKSPQYPLNMDYVASRASRMLYFFGNKFLKKTTSGTGHIFYSVKHRSLSF